MADAPDIPRPSQLWKQLLPERKLRAAEAFWKDDSASMEQTEAVLAIANRIKFRVSSVLKMPREKKARQLVALPGISEVVAARLLVAYHLDQQRPMMASFLDSLGIANDEGRIDSEKTEVAPQDEEKVSTAARALTAKFPPDEVVIYFLTLLLQDGEVWKGLAGYLQAMGES